MPAPAPELAPRPRIAPIRVALGALLIVGLTALGLAWSTPSWSALATSLGRVLDLPAWRLAALVALIGAYVLAEALRIATVGRLLGARVGVAAAVDAAIAGHFFTAIAPGAVLGEGAAAFTLARHGVPRATAVLIPTLKLATSFAVVYVVAAALVAGGLGPPAGGWLLAVALALAAAALVVVAVLVAVARRPAAAQIRLARLRGWAVRTRGPRARRLVAGLADGLDQAADRLGELGRAGGRGVAALLAVHLIYYLVYVAPLVVLCPDAPTGAVLARGVLLLCLLFLAPTPGGAGVGEASAVWFLGDLVAPADAVAIAAAYRLCTSHVHVAIGAVWVPWAAWRRRRAVG